MEKREFMEILSLGEKIKQRRKELDLTLKNLAGDRITAGQISLIESGKSNPSMDLLEYLANELNVSVEHLMETEETQAEKICVYYQNIAEVNIISGNIDNAKKMLDISLQYIEKYNLKLKKAKEMYLRSLIFMQEGKFEDAQELLLSANNIFIKNECFTDVINVFLLLGKITLQLGAYHSAYSYFQQAEKVFEESNIYNESLIGQVYYNISFTLDKLGLRDKAIKYMESTEKCLGYINNELEYGKEILRCGEEKFDNGDIESAIDYTKRSLRLYKFKNYEKVKTELLSGMGSLYSNYGYLEKSFKSLEEARKYDSMVSTECIIESLCVKCKNYIKKKDEVNAKQALNEISMMLQDDKVNNGSLVCRYHMLKYRIHLLEKKYTEAERVLLDTLSYTSKMGYKKEEAKAAITLGKFYIDMGNEEEAKQYLDYGVKVLEETDSMTDF